MDIFRRLRRGKKPTDIPASLNIDTGDMFVPSELEGNVVFLGSNRTFSLPHDIAMVLWLVAAKHGWSAQGVQRSDNVIMCDFSKGMAWSDDEALVLARLLEATWAQTQGSDSLYRDTIAFIKFCLEGGFEVIALPSD